ncbi:MAG: immunoglobulin-like domain-containing protein, partial [Sarcina sp.]
VKPQVPAPIVSGHDVTITQGSNYDNGMTGGSATVDGQNVKVTYTGNVNPNKVGVYHVTITATNSEGVTSSKEVKVTVVANSEPVKPQVPAPIVNGHDVTITQGSNYDNGMTGGSATVDGQNVKVTYTGNVNPNKVGVYHVTIIATNSEGVTSSKEVSVTVVAKPDTSIPIKPVEPNTTNETPNSNIDSNSIDQTSKIEVSSNSGDGNTINENSSSINDSSNNQATNILVNRTNNATNVIKKLPNTGISSAIETSGGLEGLAGIVSLSLATMVGALGIKRKNKKNKDNEKDK